MDRDILECKDRIEKCHKLIKFQLLSDANSKQSELSKNLYSIKRECQKKIRRILSYSCTTNIEEIIDERNINPLIPVNNDIIRLLKL